MLTPIQAELSDPEDGGFKLIFSEVAYETDGKQLFSMTMRRRRNAKISSWTQERGRATRVANQGKNEKKN